MHQIVLVLRYDGAAYHGWQVQQNATTVQGTLQASLSQITQEDIRVIGCGRTDTGVHADIYIASFISKTSIPIDKIPHALNSLLPDDIAVLDAFYAPFSFHPIRSCAKKEYTYFIYTSKVRDPFLNNRALHLPYGLDIEKVKSAAKHFIGTHDFASMRSLGTDVSSTVRTIYDYDIQSYGNIIKFIVSADGFLYNMARTMAGTLLHVSSGKIRVDEIPKILLRCNRTLAGPTAPACGLHMTRLWYDYNNGLKEFSYGK